MRRQWRRQICTNCPIVGDSSEIVGDSCEILPDTVRLFKIVPRWAWKAPIHRNCAKCYTKENIPPYHISWLWHLNIKQFLQHPNFINVLCWRIVGELLNGNAVLRDKVSARTGWNFKPLPQDMARFWLWIYWYRCQGVTAQKIHQENIRTKSLV